MLYIRRIYTKTLKIILLFVLTILIMSSSGINAQTILTGTVTIEKENTPLTGVSIDIDLEAKTIKKLDLSYSNSFGVAVGVYENNVVFGLATTSANGFYTYNPSTGEVSSSAIITTEGYPYSFVTFE